MSSYAPTSSERAHLARLPEGLASALARVRAYVRPRVPQLADAEDIVQESLARTIRRAREIDIARPDFFALSVARNLLADRARGGDAPSLLDDGLPCPLPLPDQQLEDKQRLAVLRAALAAMPPLRYEIFMRRRVEGQSREEIAAATGLQVEAVKKHISRALAQLAMAMEQAERESAGEGQP